MRREEKGCSGWCKEERKIRTSVIFQQNCFLARSSCGITDLMCVREKNFFWRRAIGQGWLPSQMFNHLHCAMKKRNEGTAGWQKAISSVSVSSQHKNVNQNAGFKALKRNQIRATTHVYRSMKFGSPSFVLRLSEDAGRQRQKQRSFLLPWNKTDYGGFAMLLRPPRPCFGSHP